MIKLGFLNYITENMNGYIDDYTSKLKHIIKS